MRKITLAIAIIFSLTMVSCNNKNDSLISNSHVTQILEVYFKEAKIDLADDMDSILCIDKSGNQFLIFGEKDDGYVGYITDNAFVDSREFLFAPEENEIVKNACMSKFGKTAVLTVLDEELMLYIFSADGEMSQKLNLGRLEYNIENDMTITANDDEFIININNEALLSVSADGTIQGEIDCNNKMIFGLSRNNEGVPTVILENGGDTEIAHVIGTELSDLQKTVAPSSSPYAVCSGNDEYSLFANYNDGLYGLKENIWLRLTDYVDNSFSAVEICGIQLINENEFAAIIKKDGEQHLILLTDRDVSEINSRKTLTLAVFGDASNYIGDEIRAFNNTNENYRIELKTYNGGNYIENSELIREDILSGNTPDIIQNNPGILSPDSFGARESIFVDMYELIDNDPKLSRDDFLDDYLEEMDFNGKLLEISPGFTVNTMTIKDKYLNSLTAWTFDEMMDIINSRPAEMGIISDFQEYTRSVYMLSMIDYCSFIDFEKASCCYDSDEFINIMKSVQENEIGMTAAENDSYLNDEDFGYSNGARNFIDDNYLINVMPLHSAHDIQTVVKGEFNEPCTFIGYPVSGVSFSPDENRCFSIMRSCEYPEGAWEFIRDSFFTDNFYSSQDSCFPAIESSFTKNFESEKSMSMYKNPATGEMESSDFYITDTLENAIYFDPFSDSEVEKYSEFVREAAKHRRRYDFTVFEILDEELTSYFEGERSAEETADIIQSRVSIYVSENYQ